MAARLSRVVGLAEARRALKLLPDRVQKRVLRNATAAGATVMRRAVKAAAPTGAAPSAASGQYGRLKDNIRTVRLKRGLPDTTAAYRVDTGPSFWGMFLEFGTRLMAARPWFRPAADAAADSAVGAIKERLAAGVAREAEKLGKR